MKIFVAGPFNGTEEEKEFRVERITNHCVNLFNEGHTPVSPLLMGLVLAKHGNMSTDTETWAKFSESLMNGCDEMHILKLDGFDRSGGVKIEMEEAKRLSINIKFLEV